MRVNAFVQLINKTLLSFGLHEMNILKGKTVEVFINNYENIRIFVDRKNFKEITDWDS